MDRLTANELSQFREWANDGDEFGADEVLRLIDHIDALESALDKAHEAAEISECRIAEVYDRIVKARDQLRPWLEPGSAQGDAMQAAFQCLQEAKYGLGGRTNVAGTIAQLKRPATAPLAADKTS